MAPARECALLADGERKPFSACGSGALYVGEQLVLSSAAADIQKTGQRRSQLLARHLVLPERVAEKASREPPQRALVSRLDRAAAQPLGQAFGIAGARQSQQIMQHDVLVALDSMVCQATKRALSHAVPRERGGAARRERKAPQRSGSVRRSLVGQCRERKHLLHAALVRVLPLADRELEHQHVPLQMDPITAGTRVRSQPVAQLLVALPGPTEVEHAVRCNVRVASGACAEDAIPADVEDFCHVDSSLLVVAVVLRRPERRLERRRENSHVQRRGNLEHADFGLGPGLDGALPKSDKCWTIKRKCRSHGDRRSGVAICAGGRIYSSLAMRAVRVAGGDLVTSEPPDVAVSLLGPLEVEQRGQRRNLPRSKKTRALLAYLAATGRPHRRERLCSLLWDVTDDPRGALRWSLSRLRKIFDGPREIITADREEVAFVAREAVIDARELTIAVRRGLDTLDTAELERLASMPRGAFLEGLELPDFLDYNAWCIAERERLRQEHCCLLEALVLRYADQPERALPHARQRARLDQLDVSAQTQLLQLLVQNGASEEARQRFSGVLRLWREVGAAGSNELRIAWQRMQTPRASDPVAVDSPPTPAGPSPKASTPPMTGTGANESARTLSTWPFVGRSRELGLLEDALKRAQRSPRPCVVLVTGEPGSGKSRIAERLASTARTWSYEVLAGRAFEAESSRPYGPWVDALQLELQRLVPTPGDDRSTATRDAMFAEIAREVSQVTMHHAGLLLILDDVQWLDSDSAELLHYLSRTLEAGPVVIALLARGGELADNESALRALRGMRREGELYELDLQPLSESDIRELVVRHANVDATSICEACAGNPLYAIELARAQSTGMGGTPPTLLQLVRERVEQLPPASADVLRWGAVLGHAVDIDRLESVSSLSLEELVTALERLEQTALLRIDSTRESQRYVFAHDVVREVVYGDLSLPRRRLMHRKVAHLLEPQARDAAIATEVAHHAALAGEALLGVQACVVAANQSLRVFANGDAETLARRGLRLAETLQGADRVTSMLDLLHVLYSARTPDRDEAAGRVRQLAEQALDLGLTQAARLGFQMLSFLRWESSSMAAAHDNIMQAERVSRSAGPRERTTALAQAAKCLVLLERNLAQAEAFVMEADGLAARAATATSAISFASGMISAHRGELDRAAEAFREARELAREHGDRLGEFCAVEHWVMLEIDRGNLSAAVNLAVDLAELGQRVRKGAEAPAGRALHALAKMFDADTAGEEELDAGLNELRVVDAKYEQAYLLTRWAHWELCRGRDERAKEIATEALQVAKAIGRASETALAQAVLFSYARRAGDLEGAERARRELDRLVSNDLSHTAKQIAGEWISAASA